MRRNLALFMLVLCGCSTTVIQSGPSASSTQPSPAAASSSSSAIPDFGVTLGTQLDFCGASHDVANAMKDAPYLAGDNRGRQDLLELSRTLDDLGGQFIEQGETIDGTGILRMSGFLADLADTIPARVGDAGNILQGLRDQNALLSRDLKDVQGEFLPVVQGNC